MKKQRGVFSGARPDAQVRKRIVATRARAEFVGFLYLLGLLGVAAIVCFPMFENPLAVLDVTVFWKEFKNPDLKSENGIVMFANAVMYGLILLTAAINVIRGFTKLSWLFKKRASKSYGFNRNVYAMDDLGKLFSGSFAAAVIFYFLIYLLSDGGKFTDYAYIALGGCLFFHFFCGFIGGKASLFDMHKGVGVLEEKRVVGRLAPIVRNVLQLLATATMMYMFFKATSLRDLLFFVLGKGNAEILQKDIAKEFVSYISFALQLITLLCMFVLIKHATAATEFDIDGTLAKGMKNYRVFSFFVVLSAGGTALCRYIFGEVEFVLEGGMYALNAVKSLSTPLIILAAIAFVMFIIENVMHNMPHVIKGKQDKEELKEASFEDEDEEGFDFPDNE